MSTFTNSALLLLWLFLSTSTLAARLDNNIPAGDLNLVLLNIRNDLPADALPLDVMGTFHTSKYRIEPSKEFVTIVRETFQAGRFLYGATGPTPVRIATVILFDPNGEDKGQKRVFWSVRSDGFYRSWDKTNWVKKDDWGSPSPPK